MFKEIKLKVGAGESSPPLTFEPGPMTVFVGPNNSGKSLILQEIPTYVGQGGGDQLKLIDQLLWKELSVAEAEELLLGLKLEGPPTEDGIIYIQSVMGNLTPINLEDTAEYLSRTKDLRLLQQLFSAFSIVLDGQARLQLAQPFSVGGSPVAIHPVARLFHDKAIRARLREDINDALGLYYTISPMDIGKLVPSVADSPPQHPEEDEWALDERGKRFFSRTTPIQGFSDGIKAFTGLMASVISSDYRVILIDEPEAFLHPPLVRKLGRRLTELAAVRGGNIFASTHSADFIMGCVQSGKRMNIVRLTYKKGVGRARILPAEELRSMMRDPLLRSTGVLSGLFHEGAVVCEGDTDRAFYQEVNERLLAGNQGGSADTLFLNAQNKSTVRRIIRPLREMGIPAAAIVDIDILNNQPDFTDLLQAAAVPKDLQLGWGQVKGQLYPKIKSAGKNITNLDHASREAAEKLFNDLAEYGIFVVPLGEVEDWLSTLSVVRDKREWLHRIFERMGTDPADENYVGPAEGDVWEFMRKLAMWIRDPFKKGIPG